MVARKVTDIDILKACLDLQPPFEARGSNIARLLEMSESAVHRRLHLLEEQGLVRHALHRSSGIRVWVVKPSCLDDDRILVEALSSWLDRLG